MRTRLRLKVLNEALIIIWMLLCSGSGFAQPASNKSIADKYPPVYPDINPICSCKELIDINIPNTTIQSAQIDTSGNHCLVTAVVNHPPANDQVKVWTGLPIENWNGRFYGTGGGGFVGGAPFSLNGPVRQGFVTGATDTGHEGGDGSFALDTVNHLLNWQLIRDNAYLGIHDMTLVGKALAEAFYGKPAAYSYFVGGSTGGRQGLMEAQRYPEDYNGIFSGCPAINWSRFIPSEMWPQVVMLMENNFVSNAKLDAVTKAVIEAVDGNDGVVDGVIDDPVNCKWDPKVFAGTVVGEGKFTDADARVVRKIWEGPSSYEGKPLWYGLTRGTDLTALAGTKGNPLAGEPFIISLAWFRYFLTLDPRWDPASLNYSKYELFYNQSVEQFTEVIGTDNPDLTRFRDHGGKLIIMHGLSDQLIFPQGTVEYFERVQNSMGGAESVANFARLFLLPGLNHGFDGEAPKPVGRVDLLINWVENGKVPESILCELRDKSGNLLRTRPAFPYPFVSRFTGSGSKDDAANYKKSLPE